MVKNKIQETEEEALSRKHEEEALNRKAKAGLQWCYTCTVKLYNNFVKRESTIKQVTCQKCGKVFKTNRNTKLCFKCEKDE
jgi:RecJ-like exonuclease